MAIGPLNFCIQLAIDEANNDPWLLVVLSVPLLPLLFGVYVVIKNLRNKGPKEVSAIMAMQVVYLSNALLCLFISSEDMQIGAYCGAVTSVVYILQIILAVVKPGVLLGGVTNSSE